MIKRSVILIVAMLVLAIPIFAQDQEPSPASDFRVRLNDTSDGVIITGYVGNSSIVIIPAEIEGYPVIEIGFESFQRKNVTSVIIPNTVKKISRNAFSRSSITSIHIPESVEIITASPFFLCENLESATIDNPRIKVEPTGNDNALFSNCGALNSLTLPEGMVEIPPYFVVACRSLTTIKIPDSVTVIGRNAFFECRLTSITLPDGVEKIGIEAFKNNRLTSITLPASIKKIDYHAFYGNRLTEVIIPESVSTIDFSSTFDRRSNAFGSSGDLPLSSQAALKQVGYRE